MDAKKDKPRSPHASEGSMLLFVKTLNSQGAFVENLRFPRHISSTDAILVAIDPLPPRALVEPDIDLVFAFNLAATSGLMRLMVAPVSMRKNMLSPSGQAWLTCCNSTPM